MTHSIESNIMGILYHLKIKERGMYWRSWQDQVRKTSHVHETIAISAGIVSQVWTPHNSTPQLGFDIKTYATYHEAS